MPELDDKDKRDERASTSRAETILKSAAFQDTISRVISRQLNRDRFVAVAIRQFARIPGLLDCNPYTVAACVLEAAALGLEIGLNGECWMLPFNDRDRGMEAQLQVGYQGHLALAWRSQMISGVHVDVVVEGDGFDYQQGTDGFLRHRPKHNRDVSAENILYAYAVLHTTLGGQVWRAIDKAEIERLRHTGRSANSPAWVNWYDQMAMGKVLKRALKLGPKSREVARAVELDDAVDASIRQNFEYDLPALDAGKQPSAGDEVVRKSAEATKAREEAVVDTTAREAEPAQTAKPAQAAAPAAKKQGGLGW